MREVDVNVVKEKIEDLCIHICHELSPDMEQSIRGAYKIETSDRGKFVLEELVKNLEIAKSENIPICQDTGMVVVFIEVGQDVHLVGGDLEQAIQEGVALGYEKGYLRKSVCDPLLRTNTGDNRPAIIHTSIVSGDLVQITVTTKGFGSENVSQLYMLKPSDGIEGVKEVIIKTVKDAGPNPCPPIIVGVGIGGNFEYCAYMAKKAILREVGKSSAIPYIKELETEMLDQINELGIGPAGLGGKTTALAVNIETYPTHIAGLPVAVNIVCHANRHGRVVL